MPPKAQFEHDFEDLNGSALPDEIEVDLSEEGITSKFGEEDDDAKKAAGPSGEQVEFELPDPDKEGDEDDDDPKKAAAKDEEDNTPVPDQAAIAALERTANLEASVNQTAGQIVQKLNDMESKQAEREIKQRETEITGETVGIKAQLKAALENGDTDAQIELTEKLTDLKAEARNISSYRQQREQQSKQQQPDQTQQPTYSKATVDWANQNKWFFTGENPRAKTYALYIESELKAEGFDVSTKDFYDELDKRLTKAYPAVKGEKPAGDDPLKIRSKLPANTAGVSKTTQQKGGNSSKVVLNKEDLEQMRLYKLDPQNPMHLKQWAREKRSIQRTTAGGR